MSRLTVNEAGTSGYTDEIKLSPSDFTTAAGNTTTQVLIPVKQGDVIETPVEMFRRVAHFIASADSLFDPGANIKKTEDVFF